MNNDLIHKTIPLHIGSYDESRLYVLEKNENIINDAVKELSDKLFSNNSKQFFHLKGKDFMVKSICMVDRKIHMDVYVVYGKDTIDQLLVDSINNIISSGRFYLKGEAEIEDVEIDDTQGKDPAYIKSLLIQSIKFTDVSFVSTSWPYMKTLLCL